MAGARCEDTESRDTDIGDDAPPSEVAVRCHDRPEGHRPRARRQTPVLLGDAPWIRIGQWPWQVLADPGSDLRATVTGKLRHDVLDVRAYRSLGDRQMLGDLAVGQAARHQARDLLLPAGQRRRASTRAP